MSERAAIFAWPGLDGLGIIGAQNNIGAMVIPKTPPRSLLILTVLLVFAAACAVSTPRLAPAFAAIALGTSGGLDEGDLTSFLLGPTDGASLIALDAGTLYAGIARAARRGAFAGLQQPPGSKLTLAGHVLKERLRAVFVSHAHLDHLAGLVITSPDAPKPLHALDETHDALLASVWNNRLWVNFSNEGEKPLRRFSLVRMARGVATPVAGTELSVEAWPLSHGALTSTAFLVRDRADRYALYLGDTGADRIEKSTRLRELWTRVAPLARDGRLRAVFLECSYPDPRKPEMLFGHLVPSLIEEELAVLAKLADPARPDAALRALTLVVTHVKPTLEAGVDVRALIWRQLAPLRAKLRVVLPRRGERVEF